jgi:hypothetical protein
VNKNRVFRLAGEALHRVGLSTGAARRKALGSSPVLAAGAGRATFVHTYKMVDGKVVVGEPLDVVRRRDLR